MKIFTHLFFILGCQSLKILMPKLYHHIISRHRKQSTNSHMAKLQPEGPTPPLKDLIYIHEIQSKMLSSCSSNAVSTYALYISLPPRWLAKAPPSFLPSPAGQHFWSGLTDQ